MQVSTLAIAEPPNALALNAVASISLPLFGPNATPAVFERMEGVENEPLIHTGRKILQPPARLPSRLPPPGNLHLRVLLGKRISHGRVGVVYEATVSLEDSSPAVASYALPPLVAKISRQKHCEDLENEVYYYDELESLQGVVVPRCYGLFQTRVRHGLSVIPPNSDELEDTQKGIVSVDSAAPKAIAGIVSVMLLERLGGPLPVGKPLPEGTYEEIMDMYSDLAHLGVDHCDIRWANILYALPSPPSFPSLPSPYSGKTYRWRLVDFDNAQKTNQDLRRFHSYHKCYVGRLLEMLPTGYIVEPWEC
ncbi:hypothetical protein NM688_g756 [Phlebia brevispora]|uniref:Uncharacterized protein n=1 Tax=Phlebia brevispora TaxID=194682 RepID=A0ACC1TDF0_9APHY|nr:hypothetical protein NM688_g756 [Phlebia brevispora]